MHLISVTCEVYCLTVPALEMHLSPAEQFEGGAYESCKAQKRIASGSNSGNDPFVWNPRLCARNSATSGETDARASPRTTASEGRRGAARVAAGNLRGRAGDEI